MLSAESAELVRATLPAVGGALEQITTRFYGTMFSERPDLLDGLFNRGNQASGAQRQALAGSIASFATWLLENPDSRPDALLDRIAHKHVSVGITDDQYVIVHKYLFGAIAHVLGDAVTPEVAAAWDEVYWLMAGALIAQEARLYQAAGVRPGQNWRAWRVTDRREETADTVSFVLRPADGGPAPEARAGQYVSVSKVMPDGVRQLRQYTLSSAPGEDERRITVKRVDGEDAPDGEMSNLLHATVRVGDELELSPPFGDIVLEDSGRPLVLASAGVGVTPMAAMLAHVASTTPEREVLVLHADRSPADHALRGETLELAAKLPATRALFWYENGAEESGDRTGLMDLSAVEIPAGAQAYLCGPLEFMRGARTDLLRAGVPARDVKYEVFGPDLWLADATA
ncbi:globin domain-containing protein [Streptomyces xinghaiensis]|uniref:globin domain-containing protein n=1 Tax=Streptomyces xinghaiensis TaxID=1038928 RepID=UPI00341FDE23